MLTRDIGTDYTRVTGGLDYSKTWVAPGGVEVKPFANARYDYFKFDIEDGEDAMGNTIEVPGVDFSRTVGQVGIDLRYPLINSTGSVDYIIEPRAQVTQNFGDGKIDDFTALDADGNTISLFQDSIDVDADQSLLWQSNKSTGFDLWDQGFRADLGASFIADFGSSRAHLFVGKSFADTDLTDISDGLDLATIPNVAALSDAERVALSSGIGESTSDYIGLFELDLNDQFSWTTRVRYDDDDSAFRRIDTGFTYNNPKFMRTSWRYYRLDAATRQFSSDPLAPAEAILGNVNLKLHDNWSVRYAANRDLDAKVTRNQRVSLVYNDGCTLIELMYNRNNFDSEVLRDSDGFGIRISLLTLGELDPD